MSATVAHDSFTIERQYDAEPKLVFSAFADPAQKTRWFGDPSEESTATHELDFRVGGRESWRGQPPGGGPLFTYEVLYQDIVDGARIVYSYEMTMDGKRISVSVATVEFLPDGAGTLLILTEQGAFLDGLDTSAMREHGTGELLTALGNHLQTPRG